MFSTDYMSSLHLAYSTSKLKHLYIITICNVIICFGDLLCMRKIRLDWTTNERLWSDKKEYTEISFFTERKSSRQSAFACLASLTVENLSS